MNKLTISLATMLALVSCKGPGTGPLVKDSFSKTEKSQNMNTQSNGSKVATEKLNLKIQPCKDCIKISDLLENKKSYAGKTIKVTGQITKYNPAIIRKTKSSFLIIEDDVIIIFQV